MSDLRALSVPRPASRPETAAPALGQSEAEFLWRFFGQHSKTFSLASRLLPTRLRQPIATLYYYCRMVDNIADQRILEVGRAAALHELDRCRRELEAALEGRPPDALIWRHLSLVHEEHPLNTSALFELIEGARWDLEGRPVCTAAELIDYANLVAGSVGALVLPLLLDEAACSTGYCSLTKLQRSARDLGIAMQITNVLRDVGEDLRQLDRIYLPADLLSRYGVSVEALRAGTVAPAYPELVEELMTEAERRYRAGLRAAGELPWQVRAGIRAAARMYREIHNEIRARGYDNLSQRAFVSFGRKLFLTMHDDYTSRRSRLVANADPTR